MILKNKDKQIGFIHNKDKKIKKVIKGTSLMFEQGFTRTIEKENSNSITLTDVLDSNSIKNIKIYGNTIQNQTNTNNSNVFDGIFESGNLNYETGVEESSTIRIRSKNFIDLQGSRSFNVILKDAVESSMTVGLRFYDENKNYIGRQSINQLNTYFTKYVDNSLDASKTVKYLKIIPVVTDINLKLAVSIDGSTTYTDYIPNSPSPDYPAEIQEFGDLLLPEEYQQVEYIESTGTQYINTGVNADSDLSIEAKLIQNNPSQKMMGALYIDGTNYIRHHFNFGATTSSYSNTYYYGNGSASVSLSKPDLENIHEYKIDIYNKRVKYDDQDYKTISYSEYFDTALNYYLFARNRSNAMTSQDYTQIKLYYFKMYKKDILVRDFIPCYRKSDNTIGMYDLVSKTFYENNGTGTFLKGDNKNQYIIPIEVKSENACFEILKKEDNRQYYTVLCVKYEENKLKPNTYYSVIGKCTPNSRFYIDNNTSTIANAWTSVNVGDDGILFYTMKSKSDISTMQTIKFNGEDTYQILKVALGGNEELPNFRDVMIVEGQYTKETMPDYEKYINENTNIILNEPLRKTNDILDYIDFKNKKIVRNNKCIIFDGIKDKLKMVPNATEKRVQSYQGYELKKTASDLKDKSFCSHSKLIGDAKTWNSIEGFTTNNSFYMYSKKFVNFTENEINQWLQDQISNNTPLKVIAPINNQKIESIQIDKPIACENNCNIIINTSIVPSNMIITYKSSK